jgi:hypothetical protein
MSEVQDLDAYFVLRITAPAGTDWNRIRSEVKAAMANLPGHGDATQWSITDVQAGFMYTHNPEGDPR